jgi:hypothetical protein
MYTRNADRLMLFWRLCQSRRASDLVWRRSVQAALLAPSSAVAIRTNRTAKLKELQHDHTIEDASRHYSRSLAL